MPGYICSLSLLQPTSYELRQSPLTLTMPSTELGGTIGALQIGVLISYVLFGVTTTQAYIYYGRFPGDLPRLKLLVAFVWFCELAHVICFGHTIYVMTISDFGQPERLAYPPETLFVAVIFSCVISASVQGFFAFRIYRFSERLYIPCLSWILTVVRSVCSLIIFVAGLRMSTFPVFAAQMSRLLVTTWTVSAINDLLIAISLVYFLYRQRTSANLTRTVAVIDKLIAWTIETGVLTSTIGIATLILFLKQPDNYAWLACFAVGARLFANSLLANLNSRTSLRGQDRTIGLLSTRDVMPQFESPITVEVELSKATHM
ncbi:hypothetical protein B0H11DRAFT_1947031 [Mycena galericulata]|nr:hypothetical protein B0H11DRAFT_1947031 [Mycena galericulata]